MGCIPEIETSSHSLDFTQWKSGSKSNPTECQNQTTTTNTSINQNPSFVSSPTSLSPTTSSCASSSQNTARSRSQIPCALDALDGIQNALTAHPKQLCFLLDYDGTLSPIVENPALAFLPEKTRNTLEALSNEYVTAIVSGRSLEKLEDFVQLKNIIYAGSHGFEIKGPKGTPRRDLNHLVASDFIPSLQEAMKVIVELIQDIPGASVEDNRVCFSVHYRLCDEKHVPLISQHIENVLEGFPNLKRTAGKCVYEIRPKIDWNKGKAVAWVLNALELNENEIIPVYIGDDKTDEDAFQALDGRGICCLVATDEEAENSQDTTYADLRLRNPEEVHMFLESFRRRERLS